MKLASGLKGLRELVGVAGFEPATPTSRTWARVHAPLNFRVFLSRSKRNFRVLDRLSCGEPVASFIVLRIANPMALPSGDGGSESRALRQGLKFNHCCAKESPAWGARTGLSKPA